MKKLIKIFGILVIAMGISTSVFSMASKPPVKSKQWYLDESRNRCLSFGDYWGPNFRYEVKDNIWKQPGNVPDYKFDSEGNKIPLITCAKAPKAKVWNLKLNTYVELPAVACFDEARPEFKKEELDKCQKPFLDYAFTCFDAKGLKVSNCALKDPA